MPFIHLVWEIAFSDILKSSIKLNFHISWVQIASIFDLVLHLLLTHICFGSGHINSVFNYILECLLCKGMPARYAAVDVLHV